LLDLPTPAKAHRPVGHRRVACPRRGALVEDVIVRPAGEQKPIIETERGPQDAARDAIAGKAELQARCPMAVEGERWLGLGHPGFFDAEGRLVIAEPQLAIRVRRENRQGVKEWKSPTVKV
jgi:hypothetical protein